MNKTRLRILSRTIESCNKCPRLRSNGIAVPYWTPNSKYGIMAEAPGGDEVKEKNKTPLVGAAGKKCFRILSPYGFIRQDFMIINSAQCRPVENGRNGKPTVDEMRNCDFWIDRYIENSEIKHFIAFGTYAMSYFTGQLSSGITKLCGTMYEGMGMKVFPCVHPASLLYNPDYMPLFRKSIKRFKKEVERDGI